MHFHLETIHIISVFLLVLLSTSIGHNAHKQNTLDNKVTDSHFVDHDEHGKLDHDALFGSTNENLSQLAPDEIKRRLRQFIENGKLDANNDGFVTKSELSKWVHNSFQSISRQDAIDQLHQEDTNGDEKISWNEHFKNNFNEGSDQSLDEKEMIYEDRELFNAADRDHDGLLDETEFALFSSPEDFPEMYDTLYRLTMRRRDINGDGKLSFDEFIVNNKGVMPDRASEAYLIDKENFENELDKNKNQMLEKEEVISWIVPNADQVAEEEADHLIGACDDNKDGQLSLDEIVNNYDVFIESEVTEFGDQLKKLTHDEL